ncbi:MAG: carbamoyltransferase HypF [Candidatus Omnitrophica bacterium]|nr:carbamoyltransferase HypF [Candidatus Omnitrophota bacterium]
MKSSANVLPIVAPEVKRLRICLRGAVQGVGFRPFVFRLAGELGVAGWVSNSAQGVAIEVEGAPAQLKAFLLRLERDKPPRSFIQSLESSWLDPLGYSDFKIRASTVGERTALVLPDIATCPECRREIFDPDNRRYRYPFTNCTHCGPRYSIIRALPYDRAHTTMRGFVMCAECAAEYANPADRRFHAQPNACPRCGPHLELWEAGGKISAIRHEAILAAAEALRQGAILAVKGLGGFQLLVDARQEEAVKRLRRRKHREEKPFALMFPSLAAVKELCEVSELEGRLLESAEAPIVLLRRRLDSRGTFEALAPGAPKDGCRTAESQWPIAAAVAPGNPCLGIMLPYTPLHHLLMAELGFPVVATSGNQSEEPICIDEREALERLAGIADMFLVHNRPIARPVDDSVARVLMGRELVLRRARGYALLPIHLRRSLPAMLAVGAHQKNTVAISVGTEVFMSQHIGDLETVQAYDSFRRVIADLGQLYELHPAAIACDAHPEYRSTQFAREWASGPGERPDGPAKSAPVVQVQHHYAHVLACMAENDLEPPVLGVAWDGTGYGLDGTVWGGEFLGVTEDSFQRLGSFRPFRLPGGEKAVQEPRRSALGLLFEIFGSAVLNMSELAPVRAFNPTELEVLLAMLGRNLNSPLATSAGRLFDAVAALAGLRQKTRFEGQASMELEYAIDGIETDDAYPFRIIGGKGLSGRGEEARGKGEAQSENECPLALAIPSSRLAPSSSPIALTPLPLALSPLPLALSPLQQPRIMIDWEPMVWGILEDMRCRVPASQVAVKFHNALVEGIVAVARVLGHEAVALSGGCFQNRYLTERAVKALSAEGFRPYWHQRVPPNDGGIALGQIVAAAR